MLKEMYLNTNHSNADKSLLMPRISNKKYQNKLKDTNQHNKETKILIEELTLESCNNKNDMKDKDKQLVQENNKIIKNDHFDDFNFYIKENNKKLYKIKSKTLNTIAKNNILRSSIDQERSKIILGSTIFKQLIEQYNKSNRITEELNSSYTRLVKIHKKFDFNKKSSINISNSIKSFASINDHQTVIDGLSYDYHNIKKQNDILMKDLNESLKELRELKEIYHNK
jgi:hypothetical protein